MKASAQKRQAGNGHIKRLAEVLAGLPERVRYEVLDSAAKHLVAEGHGDQLAFLFGSNAAEGAPAGTVASASPVAYPTRARRRRMIAFGWYGGKFSHLGWLLPLLPKTRQYCEPFGGSAAVLLNREPSPVETYNDIDGEVVNFFRVLRSQGEELVRAIGLTPFSREEFAQALRREEGLSDLERARCFFIRARQVRTGLAQTASIGRWANCKGTSRAGMAGVVSRWLGSIEGLPHVALRLLRVQIEDRPAIDVIRLYDSEDTLFYCDPPYPHETRGDTQSYRYEMEDNDHVELARALAGARGKVAVSGYVCNLMNELYGNWRRIDAPEKNCHSVKKPRREALWVNY